VVCTRPLIPYSVSSTKSIVRLAENCSGEKWSVLSIMTLLNGAVSSAHVMCNDMRRSSWW
jgi:hypothetical protein